MNYHTKDRKAKRSQMKSKERRAEKWRRRQDARGNFTSCMAGSIKYPDYNIPIIYTY